MDLARNLKIDSVSRLTPSPPLRAAPTETVAEAVARMRQANVGCLLVCQSQRLGGLFNPRGLFRRVLAAAQPLPLPVGQFMTTNPVTVQAKDPIAVAVRRMEEGGYRHLPVVDEKGRPVGMLSVKRIVHY